MKWYAVHVFADYEFKIKETLLKSIAGTPMEKQLGQVLIPTQKSFHIRNGKRVEREKKIFSNYIIVQADLSTELHNAIVRINGVTRFLGSKRTPLPLTKGEVDRILGKKDEKKTKDVVSRKFEYMAGEMVRITSGPFTDFTGTIEKAHPETNKVNVNVTVFGRITPVELNTQQIEKIK